MTNQQLLTAVEAAIAGTLERGVASYQVAGRALSTFNLKELVELRTQLLFAVARETGGGCSVAQFRRPD